MKPERPNVEGESPVLIRWIVETDKGWLGSWDEAPLAEYCELKRQLAEARAALGDVVDKKPSIWTMWDYGAWMDKHEKALDALSKVVQP